MAKPKIKDLLALLKNVSQGLKDTAKTNATVQALGQTVRRYRPNLNISSAQRSGLAAGHIVDVVRENARMLREQNSLRQLPSLGGLPVNSEVNKTTKRILGYEKIITKLTKDINTKGLMAAFPRHLADSMDSYVDKYQKMLKDVERNAELTVNRADMASIKSDIRASYGKVQSITEKIYASGYLNNSQLTSEQIQQASILLTQLELEHNNIDAINKSVRKSTRMAENITQIAERKKDQYNRAIDHTFQNIQNIGSSFASKDLVGMASGMYGIARMGIKAAGKKKAGFEGEDLLNKQLGGLSKSLGKLAILKIVLEGLKAITQGATYFSDKASDLNKELTDVHGLAAQGINMGVTVKYDQLKDSFNYYRKLFLDFGADTKTWLQPEELRAITGAMEPYGVMLQDVAGTQEQFNQQMLSIVSTALQSGLAAPEMAGHIASFSQQFGTDLGTSNAYLAMFAKSAKEADIPARFLIEGIRSASADLSVAGESILFSMEMQKKNLKSGRSNLHAGMQAFEAYKTTLTNMKATDIARLRDQIGSDALTKEAGRKLRGVNAEIASGTHKGDDLHRLERQQKSLEAFMRLDPAEQSTRFGRVVGDQGVHNIVAQVMKLKFPDKLKDIVAGRATFSDQEETEIKTLLGLSSEEFDKVILGLTNSMDITPEEMAKRLSELKDAQKDTGKSASTISDEMSAYMAQQAKLADITQSAFNKILGNILTHTENILAGVRQHWLLKHLGGGNDDAEKYQRIYNTLLDKIMAIAQMEPGKERLQAVQGLNSLLAEFKGAGGNFQDLFAEMQSKGIPEDILTRIKGAYDKVAASNFNQMSGTDEYGDKALSVALDEAGITDATERAAFLGQMAHESGNFMFNEEQISDEAAEKKYGAGSARNRDGGLGNTAAGDGAKYKGRGYVQLTGKWNYNHYGKMIGVDLVNHPELAADPTIAKKIAIAYWQDRVKKTHGVKNFSDTRAITKAINGGYTHLKERQAAFNRYKNSPLASTGAVKPADLKAPTKSNVPKVPGSPSNQAGSNSRNPPPPKNLKKAKDIHKKKERTITVSGSVMTDKPNPHTIRGNSLTEF